jgi:hypothetical protein
MDLNAKLRENVKWNSNVQQCASSQIPMGRVWKIKILKEIKSGEMNNRKCPYKHALH